MVAADKSNKEGTEMVLIVVPDPPQARGVKAAPEIGKQRLKRNVVTMARWAIERASAGRSTLIWTNPNLVDPNMEIDNICTTLKSKKDSKSKRAQPLG